MDIQRLCELLFFLMAAVVCHVCQAQRRSRRLKITLHALIPKTSFLDDLNRTLFVKFQPRGKIRLVRTHRNMFSAFDPQAQITALEDDSPNEILKAFCDTSFSSNAITFFHINNPLSMAIGRKAANKYINQLSEYLGVPMISWDSEYSSAERKASSRTLQIAPTLHHQSRAMLDMLKQYNWTDFTTITTYVNGYEDFVSSLRSLVKTSHAETQYTSTGRKTFKFNILYEVHIRDGRNLTQIEDDLSKLVNTHTRILLLHCDSLESKNILDVAAKLKLTTKDYVWIISSSSVTRGLGIRAYGGFPYGLFAISYESKISAMERAINTGVSVWMSALNQLARNRTLLKAINLSPRFSCNDTHMKRWKDGGEFYNYMRSTKLKGLNPIEFDYTGVLKHTELQILNVQRDGLRHKKYVEVGTWSWKGLSMKGITWSDEASKPPKGKPEKYFLKVIMWKEDPYVMYRNFSPAGKCDHNSVPCRVYPRNEEDDRLNDTSITKCCAGLSVDLLQTLSERLHFDYILYEVADGQWGSEDTVTHEWNGVIRALKDNEAHMAIGSLTITPERNKEVDFSVPFLETGITIIVSLREGAISPTAFLEPYDYPSWCLILVFSVHATGASIFIFEWLSPYGLDQGKTPLRDHKFSLFRSFWLIWAMLFSAAVSTDTPRGISSRFLANLWALFAVVFLASYTANLAAFMITKEEYYDLTGIQDWRLRNPYASKPPFKYATTPNSSTEFNIKQNHFTMYEYMKKHHKKTVSIGIAALKNQDIQAFIYDATVLEYYVGKDDGCKLRAVGKWYAMTGYGVGFPRGSPWLEKVNTLLLELQDSGYIEKLQKFWLAGACKKKKTTGVSSHTLGILNFTSAFILLGGGMVLGAILLFSEHLYFRFGRKSLKKWDKCGCCSLVSLSMGKSLTFEQSVMEAIDLHKRHKCKDPLCETQLWKVRHELDLALLKIDNLQKQLSRDSSASDGAAVWKYDPEATRQPNGVPRRRGRDRVEPVEGELVATEPLLQTHAIVDERADNRRPEDYSLPSSPIEDDSRITPKGARKHDGKYYFGVDDKVEMESAF